MKLLRRVLAVILCISMMFLGIIGACAVEISDAVHAKRNWEATLGYTKMIESFDLTGTRSQRVYPEEYGGAYIDSNDFLVVQYVAKTNNSGEILQQETSKQFSLSSISEITGLSTVKTHPVQYSYNELVAANNVIGSFIPKWDLETGKLRELPEEKASVFQGKVVRTGIDPKNNCVIVWLDDISQERIDAFRSSISDAPFLKFEHALEERPTYELSYKSGEGWVNGVGSIGFPATCGSYSGFVTAFHCSELGTNTLNGVNYGSRMTSSAEYDFAFIRQMDYTNSVTRGIYGTTKMLATTYTELCQGSDVGRTGCATGFQTGEVVLVQYDNELGSDLYATTCASAGGDSGGPYFSSPSLSTTSIVGIHLGYDYIGDFRITCYRGIQYIIDAGIYIA